MAAQFSTRVRDGWLASTETTIGESPEVRFLTGTKPANCAAAETGDLLASVAAPADWMDTESNGTKVLKGSWTIPATGDGTAGYYRIIGMGGVCDEQGTITLSGGGGDMTVDNTSIKPGQGVTVLSKTLIAGGA